MNDGLPIGGPTSEWLATPHISLELDVLERNHLGHLDENICPECATLSLGALVSV